MILWGIYLYLKQEDFRTLEDAYFDFKTRYLCNFIQRQLGNKIKTENYNKFCVKGAINPLPGARIVIDRAASVEIPFDKEKYLKLDNSELDEYFISLLIEGMDKAKPYIPIPYSEMMNAINEFRRLGYKNEWVHQTKLNKKFNLKAALFCRLTKEYFSLNLIVTQKEVELVNEEIFHSKPDEIMFKKDFRDLIWMEDKLVITEFLNRIQWAFTIDGLLKGELIPAINLS